MTSNNLSHMSPDERMAYHYAVEKMLKLKSVQDSLKEVLKFLEAEERDLEQASRIFLAYAEHADVSKEAKDMAINLYNDTLLPRRAEVHSAKKRTHSRLAGKIDFEVDLEYAKAYPLIRLLEEYSFPMKKMGNKAVMLCPFHEEKTASFTIYEGDSHAHCFGCSWHGDTIEFVKKYEGLDFKGAVKFIKGK